MGDELARRRRELAWVRLDKEYALQTADGSKTLPELFDGRSQLVVYHFMFEPEWDAGCKHCSFWADNFNGIVVHNHQQVNGPTGHYLAEPYVPHPPKAPLRLQEHGHPVRYRSIWYRPIDAG